MLHPAAALWHRSPLTFRLFMSGVSTPVFRPRRNPGASHSIQKFSVIAELSNVVPHQSQPPMQRKCRRHYGNRDLSENRDFYSTRLVISPSARRVRNESPFRTWAEEVINFPSASVVSE